MSSYPFRLPDGSIARKAADGSGTEQAPYRNRDLAELPAEQIAALASQATLAQVLAALAGTLAVSGPLTDAQLRAAALPLPQGAATEATLELVRALLATRASEATLAAVLAALAPLATEAKSEQIRALLAGTLAVSGPVTDAQLRATPVPVSGTFWQATQPVSGTVTANLGTIADVATQTTLEAARALLAGVLSVAGSDVNAVGTMTRPSDTTAYAAGDGVTTATSAAAGMTVTNCARVNGGSGRIVGIRCTKSQASTTNSRFRLWIWRTAPAIPNDNAAYSPSLRANNADLVGTAEVNFSSGVVGSDGIMATATLARSSMAFVCAGGSRDLTIVWQALEAYTPASAEVFAVAMDCAQN